MPATVKKPLKGQQNYNFEVLGPSRDFSASDRSQPQVLMVRELNVDETG